ncbi:Hypothetical predicted protein, partial [Paramuricea clavata]
MEETSEGVLEEMEEITSSVKPSGPSSSSEELTMLFDEDAFHMNIAIDIVENDDLSVENEFINALNENDVEEVMLQSPPLRNTTKECEKIEACEMGPLSYIAGYLVRKLTSARKKKSESENTELQGLLGSLQSEQENNSFIQARNRGGLVNPSDDPIGILQEAKINFRRE